MDEDLNERQDDELDDELDEDQELDESQDDVIDDPLDLMDEPPPLKKWAWWKKLITVTVIIALLLTLVVGVVVMVTLYYYAGLLTPYDPVNDEPYTQEQDKDSIFKDAVDMPQEEEGTIPDLDDITPSVDDEPVQEPDQGEDQQNPPPQQSIKDKDVVNILIIGQDSKSANIRTRSDTMILITVHTKAKQVTITSFMRDAYVKIPGYANNKLNSAYEKGGLKLLNETLKVNFGVEVDGNVIVNFSSFKEIIDMLGGVDINLTKREAEYMTNGGKHNVKPGMNRLTGAQALDYARLREIDSDYQRTSRQRTVILSLIERYKNLPVLDMVGMLDDILPHLVTNMEKNEIVDLVLKCAPIAPMASYAEQQIPASGTFKQGYVKVREGLKNWFQYNIDFDKNRTILENIMNGTR